MKKLVVCMATALCLSAIVVSLVACQPSEQIEKRDYSVIADQWTPLQTISQSGLNGERIDLWRNNRMQKIDQSGFLIDGFEHRPSEHPWQGEHMGKWLHAATLAYLETRDPQLKARLEDNVNRLMATQLPDGYLGTYSPERRITCVPENAEYAHAVNDIMDDGRSKRELSSYGSGWDVWAMRYNLFGLLFYEHYFPNEEIVNVCRKVGDLLINVYGEGKYDITKYGDRFGICAMTVLESVVMLYDRTGEQKYLDLAEHLVSMSEANPRLHIMGNMLGKSSPVFSGRGKAYEFMSNILGYLRLYQATGTEKYLTAVLNAWETIRDRHLLVTGGPWTRKAEYNGSNECFAFTDVFEPATAHVEGCCDQTWLQLNMYLFALTGEARYMCEAEKTLVNDVYAHQLMNGMSWLYFVKPNDCDPFYENEFHCCSSSLPRGLEMYAHNLVGEIGDHLVVNSFANATVQLSEQFGGGQLQVTSNFPEGEKAQIQFLTENTPAQATTAQQTDQQLRPFSKKFVLEFRLPAKTNLKSVKVNGQEIATRQNERGFHEMERTWKTGDVIEVDYQYILDYTVQTTEFGPRWVAFTYGPLALAYHRDDIDTDEPLYGKELRTFDLHDMLERIPGEEIQFKMVGTDHVLVPYYKTYVSTKDIPFDYLQMHYLTTGGPFTYFEN